MPNIDPLTKTILLQMREDITRWIDQDFIGHAALHIEDVSYEKDADGGWWASVAVFDTHDAQDKPPQKVPVFAMPAMVARIISLHDKRIFDALDKLEEDDGK